MASNNKYLLTYSLIKVVYRNCKIHVHNQLLFLFFGILLNLLSIMAFAQSGLEAKGFAYDAARQLMNSTSPLTGHNPRATIIDAQFSKSQSKYILEMKAIWDGSPCLICDETTFVIRGILKVNRDGSNPVFQELESNDAVQSAQTFNNIASVGALIMLEAMTENDKNFAPDDNTKVKTDAKTPFFIQKADKEITVYENPDAGSATKGAIVKGQEYNYMATKKTGWNYIFIEGKFTGFIRTDKN